MKPISPSSRACRRRWRNRPTDGSRASAANREDRVIRDRHQPQPCTNGAGWPHAAAFLAAMLVVCGVPGQVGAQAQTLEDLARYSGPDRTARLIAGAKREGTVTLYSSATLADQSAILRAFTAKYGVKVQQWRGSSEDIRSRALTEYANSRFDADLAETAGSEMEIMVRERLLQAVASPAGTELIPPARMPHQGWTPTPFSLFVGAYNTSIIKPADAPQTYEDLRDPGVNGK